MSGTSAAYRALVRIGVRLAPLAGAAWPKLRAGDRARGGAGARLARWAEAERDPARPLAWFHAASVGEALQAESVWAELRRLRPDCQVVYTHFSPSAEAFARRAAVDAADYLPYDTPRAAALLLKALAPDLLVYSKLDLWPELAATAAGRGVRVALVAAAVSPGSGRLRWPARDLLAPGYAAVAAAAAVAEADATRLARLGVAPERIHVVGDPRYDSVIARVRAAAPDDPLLALGRGGPTLVAGSTWPADEAVLLEAFARLRAGHPEARLILVPHEPTPTRLASAERAAARAGLPVPVRLSAAPGPAPVLLVDRVGVLATLYGAGTMAYVGGGFGGAGLHSVLEPAAWGVPVLFGPRWSENRDAAVLLEAAAATALPPRARHRAVAALLEQWELWIEDDHRRRSQGARAREAVEAGAGASVRTAALLADLLAEPGSAR